MFYEKVKRKNLSGNTIYEQTWIQCVSIAIFFMGLMNILSAWFSYDRKVHHFLKKFFEYELITGSRYLVIITGIVALIIAPALFRQKRVAWFIAVILLGVSGFAHIIKGADVIEASICILLLGILLPLYRYCYIKSDPIRLYHGGGLFIGSLLFVLVYTFIGIHIFSDKLGVDTNIFPVWKISLNALLFDLSTINPQGYVPNIFINSLLGINSFCIIMGVMSALSPVLARQLPDTNYDRLKKLINNHAVQPVQLYTLTNDYQHFKYNNQDIEGFISYKVSNRTAMAVGNPCIESCYLSEITEKWIDNVVEYDWTPAFYQAQDEFIPVLKDFGFNLIPIGVEAVINLETFTIEGKGFQTLRTANNKIEREGWIIRNFEDKDWDKIRILDQKWLKVHGLKENGFAMGKSSKKYLNETRTMVLLDKEDNLLVYLNSIELHGKNSRSVDLMRRDPESPKGAIEALFLHEIFGAKDAGYKYYDLGFSPLAKVDESISDNKLAVKLLKLIYEKQRSYYAFQGLHVFKSKFFPEWQPSFLAYPRQLDLPKVLLALLNFNRKG